MLDDVRYHRGARVGNLEPGYGATLLLGAHRWRSGARCTGGCSCVGVPVTLGGRAAVPVIRSRGWARRGLRTVDVLL